MSNPLIASGARVAFGAPCFLEGDAGDSCGVAVGVGNGVADGDVGVSKGCGDGELFLLRCGEGLGDGVAEAFFFFGLGDGDSNSCSADRVLFFFGEGVTEGDGDSFTCVGDDLLDGLGAGVGDFFFTADALFFFRGLGVGVGVEKIFLSASPSDCSAATAGNTTGDMIMAKRMRTRINMQGV